LKPHLGEDPSRIVIATDPDSAGWQSAQRAFWRLAALRAAPRHLTLPDGVDPADVLRDGGNATLRRRLADSGDFADVLIDRLLDERLEDRDDAFSRVDHCREVTQIIGALPPDHWLEHAQHIADRLDMPLHAVIETVLESGARWTYEPLACAGREFARLRASAPPAKAICRQPKVGSPAATPDTIDPLQISPRAAQAVDR
jgi:DNA primase